MGTPISKIQTGLVAVGDRLIVTTRTTRYILAGRPGGEFTLSTNNPTKKSGVVRVVGSMSTFDGTIEEGSLETGRYMVFRHPEDGEVAVKTSLVIRIEVERAGARVP